MSIKNKTIFSPTIVYFLSDNINLLKLKLTNEIIVIIDNLQNFKTFMNVTSFSNKIK